jgi:hypothetical protein
MHRSGKVHPVSQSLPGPIAHAYLGRKLAAPRSRFRLFADAIGARRLNQQGAVGIGIINHCNKRMSLKISVEAE